MHMTHIDRIAFSNKSINRVYVVESGFQTAKQEFHTIEHLRGNVQIKNRHTRINKHND